MPGFQDFIEYLQTRLQRGLPGRKAHLRMIPNIRKPEFPEYPGNGIKSSVLLLLYPVNESIYTVLIRRPVYDGVHSGQIALPGGKYQDEDMNLRQTALRESKEEVGIDTADVQVIGSLTDLLIPPSRFLLTPFIGYTLQKPVFHADPDEVAEIIEFNIHELSDKNLKEKDIAIHGGKVFRTPYYNIQNHVVWGATGMILAEFSELIKDYIG
jgi:8-oxo-dGTP pyrophosphatase MutT (NUDIX family)